MKHLVKPNIQFFSAGAILLLPKMAMVGQLESKELHNSVRKRKMETHLQFSELESQNNITQLSDGLMEEKRCFMHNNLKTRVSQQQSTSGE